MPLCGWFGQSFDQIKAYVDFVIFSKSAYFILKTIGVIQLNGMEIMNETFLDLFFCHKTSFRITLKVRKALVHSPDRFSEN